MERKRNAGPLFPDFASLHPGYARVPWPCNMSRRRLASNHNAIREELMSDAVTVTHDHVDQTTDATISRRVMLAAGASLLGAAALAPDAALAQAPATSGPPSQA